MATEIKCTPVGLQTPEGIERVSKAMEACNDATRIVAEHARQFMDQYDDDPELMGDDENYGWLDCLIDLRTAIKAQYMAQDELLRAVAGRKAAA